MLVSTSGIIENNLISAGQIFYNHPNLLNYRFQLLVHHRFISLTGVSYFTNENFSVMSNMTIMFIISNSLHFVVTDVLMCLFGHVCTFCSVNLTQIGRVHISLWSAVKDWNPFLNGGTLSFTLKKCQLVCSHYLSNVELLGEYHQTFSFFPKMKNKVLSKSIQ